MSDYRKMAGLLILGETISLQDSQIECKLASFLSTLRTCITSELKILGEYRRGSGHLHCKWDKETDSWLLSYNNEAKAPIRFNIVECSSHATGIET